MRWGFALGYRFVSSVCFAQTAALQREGRAPWVCSRGRVRQGCSRCSSVVSEEWSSEVGLRRRGARATQDGVSSQRYGGSLSAPRRHVDSSFQGRGGGHALFARARATSVMRCACAPRALTFFPSAPRQTHAHTRVQCMRVHACSACVWCVRAAHAGSAWVQGMRVLHACSGCVQCMHAVHACSAWV